MSRVVWYLAITLLLASVAGAAVKDLSEYPLRVEIVDTEIRSNPYGGAVGSGSGNLLDGDSVRGFDYTFSCDHPFKASQGVGSYAARWKAPESRLIIQTVEIGNTNKKRECELKVTMANVVYKMKDGNLATYSLHQYKNMMSTRKTLEQQIQPSDTDPTHYPVAVAVFAVEWQKSEFGYSGYGKGNLHEGDEHRGFDFTATCAGRFAAAFTGAFKGKWADNDKRIVILEKVIGEDKYRSCELKVDPKPFVYIPNSQTGLIGTETIEQYKARLAQRQKQQSQSSSAQTSASRSASAAPELAARKATLNPKLTNADIVSMVSAGLSLEVIVAKMNASETDFDTSPSGLRQLKADHVPDSILLEVIKRTKP